mgnify:CR=1 FL=1
MSLRDYIGFALSASSCCTMIWACSFDDERIMLADLLTMPGGRYKFLTILNLVNLSKRKTIRNVYFRLLFSIFKYFIISSV